MVQGPFLFGPWTIFRRNYELAATVAKRLTDPPPTYLNGHQFYLLMLIVTIQMCTIGHTLCYIDFDCPCITSPN
jgi:hypothetical protein